jgi:hypothetical protein
MATPLRIIEYNGHYVVGRSRPKGLEVVGYRCAQTKTNKPYIMTTREMAEAQLAAIREDHRQRVPLAVLPHLAETPLIELAR